MAKSTVKGTKIKLDRSDIIIRTIGYVVVTFYALACVLPFLIIIGTSFTSEEVIRTEGAQLFPKQFTTKAYEMVLQGGAIWKSYGLTITMTLTGTLVGLGIISMTGYYLLMTQTYKLQDNYLAVWLPLLMSSWLIILMKNFVKSIPHEITESGKIDGAGDMKIFTALILPMLKPALATIGLFLAIGYWNEWYQSSLFLSEKVSVYPLQYTLYKVVNKVNSLKSTVAGQYVDLSDLPSNGLKMANAILATGPVILIYPFVQRYFIGGITVGAVKG